MRFLKGGGSNKLISSFYIFFQNLTRGRRREKYLWECFISLLTDKLFFYQMMSICSTWESLKERRRCPIKTKKYVFKTFFRFNLSFARWRDVSFSSSLSCEDLFSVAFSSDNNIYILIIILKMSLHLIAQGSRLQPILCSACFRLLDR